MKRLLAPFALVVTGLLVYSACKGQLDLFLGILLGIAVVSCIAGLLSFFALATTAGSSWRGEVVQPKTRWAAYTKANGAIVLKPTETPFRRGQQAVPSLRPSLGWPRHLNLKTYG